MSRYVRHAGKRMRTGHSNGNMESEEARDLRRPITLPTIETSSVKYGMGFKKSGVREYTHK